MSRRKGEMTFAFAERLFPHWVEFWTVNGGLPRLMEMYDWHRRRDMHDRHGRGGYEDGRGRLSRWCFAEAAMADAFAAEFAGERTDCPPKRRLPATPHPPWPRGGNWLSSPSTAAAPKAE